MASPVPVAPASVAAPAPPMSNQFGTNKAKSNAPPPPPGSFNPPSQAFSAPPPPPGAFNPPSQAFSTPPPPPGAFNPPSKTFNAPPPPPAPFIAPANLNSPATFNAEDAMNIKNNYTAQEEAEEQVQEGSLAAALKKAKLRKTPKGEEGQSNASTATSTSAPPSPAPVKITPAAPGNMFAEMQNFKLKKRT
jgi:hypothetical protein